MISSQQQLSMSFFRPFEEHLCTLRLSTTYRWAVRLCFINHFNHEFIHMTFSWYVCCNETCYLFTFQRETMWDHYSWNETLGVERKILSFVKQFVTQTLNRCFLLLGWVCIYFLAKRSFLLQVIGNDSFINCKWLH